VPEIERTLPPYQQIASHLRKLIHDGELRAGDVIPSERQLCEQWGVARATAARALNTLRLEGLVESRRGIGTVVREHPKMYRRVGNRHALARRTGRIYQPDEHSKLLVAEMTEASELVAQALGVDPGAPVMHRRRVTIANHSPVEISSSYFDGALRDVCPLILGEERIPQGTAQYVQEQTGRVASMARDRVGARYATEEEFRILGFGPHTMSADGRSLMVPYDRPPALLVTEHTLWDTAGRTITFEIGVTPSPNWTDYTYSVVEDD
jgi:DNA-binding GntR family transcriptional regulator